MGDSEGVQLSTSSIVTSIVNPLEAAYMRLLAWRNLYWTALPLLAILACITVLRVGFLADDLALLNEPREVLAPGLSVFLPSHDWIFYRPVGSLLVWHLGWTLWGYNPLPYHIMGLLVHAGASLALGLWLAELTGRRWLGWLAGALFAVFPGHLEAVAWVAAQWDLWATMFVLLGLWLFTRWWRRGGTSIYMLSVLFYALSVFSKESVLLFLPVFAISTWYVKPPIHRADWRRLGVALLPLVAVLSLNLALRYISWGGLRGYEAQRTDYAKFFWDKLIDYAHVLVAPVNSSVTGSAFQQMVGVAVSLLLLLGITLYGRQQGRLLALCAAWLIMALVPVLNLTVRTDDLYANRYVYLPAAGYCVAVAALIYSAVQEMRTRRGWGIALVGLLLAGSAALCWVQLRPWHTVTLQARALESETSRLVPSQPRPHGMSWFVEDLPVSYRGAQLFPMGLGLSRLLDGGGDPPSVKQVPEAGAVPLSEGDADTFALRLRYEKSTDLYEVNYAAGITGETAPPSGRLLESEGKVWDFTACAPGVVHAWETKNASVNCEPGKGLALTPANGDAQLAVNSLDLKVAAGGARFVRLRVSASHTAAAGGTAVYQWYWHGPDNGWSEALSRTMPVKADGRPHIYWTFLPASEAGAAISALRLDPVSAKQPVEVQWIAVDLVK